MEELVEEGPPSGRPGPFGEPVGRPGYILFEDPIGDVPFRFLESELEARKQPSYQEAVKESREREAAELRAHKGWRSSRG